jgi:phospholipase C
MSRSFAGFNILVQIAQHSEDDPGTDHDDPEVPPHWYPSSVSVKLKHGSTEIPTKRTTVTTPVFATQYSAESSFHDDLWRLEIHRSERPGFISLKHWLSVNGFDASQGMRSIMSSFSVSSIMELIRLRPLTFPPPIKPRKYAIRLRYPSQLPILEREIPLEFFQKGLEENWNKQQYLDVSFEGPKAVFTFRSDLAELYKIPRIEVDLPDFELNCVTKGIFLSVGAGHRPSSPDGELSVFVSLRVHVSSGEAIADIPLVGELFTVSFREGDVIFRFYLHQGDVNRDSLQFQGEVDLHSGILGRMMSNSVILRHFLPDKIEKINREITSKNGSAHFGVLDKYLKHWLTGGIYHLDNMPFRLLGMHYERGSGDRADSRGIIEPATGKLVVSYIGERNTATNDTQLSDGSVPLFNNIGLEEQNHFLTLEGIPLPTDPVFKRLFRIDHIVVLMQENRSFDQVLGYLRRHNINNDVDGLLPDDGPGEPQRSQLNKFRNKEFRPQKAAVYSERPGPTWTSPTAWPSFSLHGPGHSADDVADQVNGGEDGNAGGMKGFVSNFAKKIGELNLFHLRQVMDYFDDNDLPVYAEIVRQFGICDKWFCSFAGGTIPNRFVALTGKLNRDKFGNIEEDNPDFEGGQVVPATSPTLFDYLRLNERSWRVYEHGYSFLRLFAKYTFDIDNIIPFEDPTEGFVAQATAGTLPDVTWIEPDYIELPPGNDDHAPADMCHGQLLVEKIVRTLVNSPKWNKTLLIITYDEHGGFYDHVTPPPNDPPLGDSRRTKGPRVPTFVISPLIKPGSVFHQQFDHSTIGATILRRFCRQQPKVSERLDNASDLSSILELADDPSPRTDFGLFGSARPIARDCPMVAGFSPSFNTDSKKEDFHWYLAVTNVFTGRSGNSFAFDRNSLRRWLILNGFDASQGMRSIMSSFSVSSIKELIRS